MTFSQVITCLRDMRGYRVRAIAVTTGGQTISVAQGTLSLAPEHIARFLPGEEAGTEMFVVHGGDPERHNTLLSLRESAFVDADFDDSLDAIAIILEGGGLVVHLEPKEEDLDGA